MTHRLRLSPGTLLSILSTTLIALSVVGNAAAQRPLSRGDLVGKIDSIAAATLSDGLVSGISIGVKRGADLLLVQGYGYADLENQVPTGPHTVYNIGSITKQFTAAAVMQLVEDGVISLGDSITKFLPGFSTQGHHPTIQHLLTHTSGIRSYPNDDTPVQTFPLEISDDDLLTLIEAEPFDFAPGTSFRYSNAGYVLLGMIVANASGRSYQQYMQDEIFGPLGLTRTSVCDPRRVTPGRASGYVVEGGELMHAPRVSPTHMGGAGFLCSSVFDLLSWSSALTAGRVVEGSTFETMVSPAALDDGTEIPYGFGFEIRARLEGRPSVFHGGGVPGVSSRLDRYPEADLTIAAISNTYGDHVTRIADAIARWVLEIPMPTILDEQRSIEELERYVGTYEVAGSDDWRVYRRDGWMFLETGDRPPSRLRSQGDHVFVPVYSDFARVIFSVEAGEATGFTIYECVPSDQSRCRTREGSRIP